MSIRCGHCKQQHETVAEVRNCAMGKVAPQEHLHEDKIQDYQLELPLDVHLIAENSQQVNELWDNSVEKEPGVWVPVESSEEQTAKDWDKMLKGIEPGYYALSEDEIYQVIRSKQGRLYAKLLVETQSGSHWEYAAGAITKLKPTMRMDLDKVAKYGKETGRCLVCGRELTNPESIERGIGPICASRF